jgi:hypothetical protein
MKRMIALAIAAILTSSSAFAVTKRSAAARAEFKRSHPCPATGKKSGACPGYIIDHVQPLCDGGPDKASNMQWQTKAAALEKDKQEWATCRAKRRATEASRRY